MITAVGKHRVKVGDLVDGIDDLMAGEQADVLYGDPPWGDRMVKYFYTLNWKQSGVRPDVPKIEGFLDALFVLAARHVRADGVVCLEYTMRYPEHIVDRAVRAGFTAVATLRGVYKTGGRALPYETHILTRSRRMLPTAQMQAALDRVSGIAAVRAVLCPLIRPGALVLDPMCGMGKTAEVAARAGARFYGNELNAKRAEQTIGKLRALA